MSNKTVPVKFVVGSRKLLSVPRTLETLAFGLETLVGGSEPTWPEASAQVDGLRVLSAPQSAIGAIRAHYPSWLLGALDTYERHYIQMEGATFAAYLAKFSSKTRSTLKRKRRKVAKACGGELDVREFHFEDDVDRFMRDAVPLSRRTYQTRLLDAGLPEGADAIAAMKQRARRDEVRAYILYINGQPASYLYLPIIRSVLVYAHLGYDPDMAKLSVGTVLQLEVMERLFAEQKYRFFDFTEGTGAHKALFGTDAVPACSFFLLKPTLANRTLLASLATFNGGVAMSKRIAERSGMAARVRAMLRGGQ
jgi:CelD/BcsL family acetyltransferase involved in cellulose biosynthesis